MRKYFLLYLLACAGGMAAQSETRYWYFGNRCALDFSSGPPASLSNSSMYAKEGCASISDAQGNLLFYTAGDTVWNSLHQVMANGTGLFGHQSATQSALIAKQPGNNAVYFIFTNDQVCGQQGLRYSTVDVSLAAGMGSVTSKNNLVHSSSTEKLCGVQHCNSRDVWIISHDCNSNVFRSHLLSPAGLSTTGTISVVGPHTGTVAVTGEMKLSPDGRKLGTVFTDYQGSSAHIFDFNASTGILDNWLQLDDSIAGYYYGCTFSPDGSRFYTSKHDSIVQWQICAGNPSGIIASRNAWLVGSAGNNPYRPSAMQIGPDNKIYVALLTGTGFTTNALGVINNPNLVAPANNYSNQAVILSKGIVTAGLPNFISSYFKQPLPAFTYSVQCAGVSFYLPLLNTCGANSNTITGLKWLFGDPASGAANTSTLNNPAHLYTSAGTFSTQLVLYYNCGSDTIQQPVVIGNEVPGLSVTGPMNICQGNPATFTVSGADTYTWNTGSQNNTITISAPASTVYAVSGTNTLSGCGNTKTFTVNVSPCTSLAGNEPDRDIRIFPNPANAFFNLECPVEYTARLFDIRGVKILERYLEPGINRIETGKLESGIYILHLHNGFQNSTFKVIIQDLVR